MNSDCIKTPLLRYVVNYFSHLGLQLHPYSLHNWRSLLNVAFNLVLNCLVAFGLSRLDILDFDTYRIRFEHQKPLYGTFLRLCIHLLLPSLFLISRIFYLLYGSHLVLLLDSPSIGKVYHSARFTKLFFFLVLFLMHVNYFLLNLSKLRQIYLESTEFAMDLITYMSQYVITFAHFLPPILGHYYQYAMWRLLVAIEADLAGNVHGDESTIIWQVQELALRSEQLNHLLSVPMLVFIFVRIINGISVFCLAMLNAHGDTLLFVGPAIITWLYVLYLVHLNRQSRDTFTRICALLDSRLQATNSLIKVANSKLVKVTLGKYLQQVGAQAATRKASIQIRYHGLQVYRDHFSMRIFSFAQMDAPFIFAVGLFILNYVVFLYQTN